MFKGLDDDDVVPLPLLLMGDGGAGNRRCGRLAMGGLTAIVESIGDCDLWRKTADLLTSGGDAAKSGDWLRGVSTEVDP